MTMRGGLLFSKAAGSLISFTEFFLIRVWFPEDCAGQRPEFQGRSVGSGQCHLHFSVDAINRLTDSNVTLEWRQRVKWTFSSAREDE